MSQVDDDGWKTAWDRVAEEEWANEQHAADEDRRLHQSPDLQLQPEALAALGSMSPEGIWLQITMLVLEAIEEHWKELEKLGQQLGVGRYWAHPKDLNELYIRATALNPSFAINEFNHVNPEMLLNRNRLFERMSPLAALRGVIRMWTDNSHRAEAL
jgi:hypothetical protein